MIAYSPSHREPGLRDRLLAAGAKEVRKSRSETCGGQGGSWPLHRPCFCLALTAKDYPATPHGSAQKRLPEPEFFSEACIDRTSRHEAPQLAQEGRFPRRYTAHAPCAERGVDDGVRHAVRLGRRFHAVDDGT